MSERSTTVSTLDVDESAGPDQASPSTTPVGHDGTRVDVRERVAWSCRLYTSRCV